MAGLGVAAIQMDARVGARETNLSQATALVEQASALRPDAPPVRLVVLPELFSTGYEYTDRNYELPEPLDGPTGTWITETARRLGVHLVGSFPARMADGTFIVAMLAAPDGRQWVYRKMHVAMWENCYYDRGTEPLVAETDLGRIGLIVCWDQVFADLARAYRGRVDLLCIPSSPPLWLGTLEDGKGRILARLERLHSLGKSMDGVDWFERAQIAHARNAGVPLVYAARCGTFYSPIPYGASFLTMLKAREIFRVLRMVGTHYWLRCPMMGRSCIRNTKGERIAGTDQDGEAVVVATVQPGAREPGALPPTPEGRLLIPGIPRSQIQFDDAMIRLGRRYRQRNGPETKPD